MGWIWMVDPSLLTKLSQKVLVETEEIAAMVAEVGGDTVAVAVAAAAVV